MKKLLIIITFYISIMKVQENLKNFVSNLIQKKAFQAFPQLYIVDKQTGPFRSIQEAINAAEPNSTIKISEGFYEQNLIINKPLRLQPKQISQQQGKIGVVLLAVGGVAMKISLAQHDQECSINGIKFSHSGNSDNNLRKELMEHQHILNIFEERQNVEQLQSEFVNRMSPNKMENIILLLERGKLTISNCVLSLNYLVKSCTSVIPAIWVEKEGHLQLMDSQIKGNQNKSTIGVICRLGALNVQNSIISNHKEGGIVIWGIKDNNSKIIKSFIENNSIGINLVGEQFKLKIISNSINKNKVGIKVGLATEPDISRNVICENENGIQIFSAFPDIALNKIQKNKNNGILCHSYKKFLCKAIIRKNIGIVGNALNGILIEGENNQTTIINNHMIGFNGQSGIRIEKHAFPTLNNNKIYKNYKEGILVVQNSSALIERNQITHNIECNIAVGGINSHHSAIIQNLIGDSPGVGLYIIRSGKLKVMRNDITKNTDGIIIQGSQAQLRRNFISQNKNNGIVCEELSYPALIENFITRNNGSGLFLRHGSGKKQCSIHSNILVSNEIDLATQQYDRQLISELTGNNTLESQIYYPQSLPCAIM